MVGDHEEAQAVLAGIVVQQINGKNVFSIRSIFSTH